LVAEHSKSKFVFGVVYVT